MDATRLDYQKDWKALSLCTFFLFIKVRVPGLTIASIMIARLDALRGLLYGLRAQQGRHACGSRGAIHSVATILTFVRTGW